MDPHVLTAFDKPPMYVSIFEQPARLYLRHLARVHQVKPVTRRIQGEEYIYDGLLMYRLDDFQPTTKLSVEQALQLREDWYADNPHLLQTPRRG